MAACGVAISGCGKKADSVAGQVESSAAFASQAQKVLKELPDSERANVLTAHEKLTASENERFASLLERYQEERDLRYVAGYIDDVSSDADNDRRRIVEADADIEQRRKSNKSKEDTALNVGYRNVEKAGHLLALSLRLDLLKKAIALDPILSEAVKARAGQTPTDNARKEPLFDVVQRLSMMPCRSVGAQAGEVGRFSARGIALGMTREQALAGVCASEKGAVMFADSPVAPYDGQPYKRDSDLPANPLAWADYRAGKVPALNEERDLEAWAAVAKPRPRPLDLCFNCETDQDREKARSLDGLIAYFSPDGRIYQIRKTQEFSQKIALDGGRIDTKPMPQPSKNVLGPLTAKFGTPSVVYESGWYTMVAWVYRDRANPLPTESWYFGKGTSNDRAVQFKDDTFLPAHLPAVKDALIKAKPVATYCMTQVRGGRQISSVPVIDGVPHLMDREWFTYATSADLSGSYDYRERFPNARGSMITAYPYSPKWEAAGYVPNCGVVITATLWHAPPGRALLEPSPFKQSGNPRAPDADTPIYYVDMQIADVDARKKTILDEATAAAQYRVTKTAASVQEQKDFNAANAYRP
jgi:hypothetical protein